MYCLVPLLLLGTANHDNSQLLLLYCTLNYYVIILNIITVFHYEEVATITIELSTVTVAIEYQVNSYFLMFIFKSIKSCA